MNKPEAYLRLREKEKQIAFNEKEHSYTYRGRTLTSVTSVIKRHFPEFDKYGKIKERIAKKNGITVKEVKNQWLEKAKTGSVVHAAAEQLIWSDNWGIEPELNLDWISDYKHNKIDIYNDYIFGVKKYILENKLDILYTELIVYSPLYSVCGTIDLVLWNPRDESLILVDWKTSATIMGEGISFGEFGYNKLAHLPATNFYQYSLQLSVYRRLLEDWGFKVSSQYLVHLANNSYKQINLPYLSDESGIILRENTE